MAAKPGDTIQVRAGNFPSNAIVEVRIAKQGHPFSGVVDGHADVQGMVSSSITVPDSAETGEQWAVSQPITIQ